MISLIFNKEEFKILNIFSISPGSKFRRNEIKEKTKLNNVPLDEALLKLVKSDIIKKERKFYSINFENSYSKLIIEIISKQYKFLKEIPLDVYFLITDLISESKLLRKTEIYLFGSYSKLIYKDTSDIDIAILTDSNFDKKSVNKIIQKLEKRYSKNIEIHLFEKSKFYKNKKDPLIKDILKNGIKLI
jgi:predicted nucleotidyltransferase